MARKKPDKLAIDAGKARAAGMSYGKWKAMQEPVKDEKKIPEGSKECPYCGKVFYPSDVRQKYCDAVCCQKANDKRHRERKRERARQFYADKKRKGADNG